METSHFRFVGCLEVRSCLLEPTQMEPPQVAGSDKRTSLLHCNINYIEDKIGQKKYQQNKLERFLLQSIFSLWPI